MSLTITSDFICPWCFIGERNALAAIRRLPTALQVDVVYRPFALNPDMPPEGKDRKSYRSAKFGSWERSQALDRQVEAAGRIAGVVFDYDKVTRTPNTMLAHRLMWRAEQDGVDQAALANRLFAAYFTDGLDVSDVVVLRAIALASGLSAARIGGVLEGGDGLAEVKALMDAAYRRGIHGVPLFEIGREALSGAQPPDVIEAALHRAAAQQTAAA